jgi:predicted RNase H-like HicB family nuclease
MITVIAQWDPDAAVWVATSQDVPGLITEAGTLELLEGKLQLMIPELFEANNVPLDPNVPEIPLSIIAHRENTVRFHA